MKFIAENGNELVEERPSNWILAWVASSGSRKESPREHLEQGYTKI